MQVQRSNLHRGLNGKGEKAMCSSAGVIEHSQNVGNWPNKSKKIQCKTMNFNVMSIFTAPGQGSSRIFILGPEDGRQRLVEIARQLSREVAAHRLTPNDITVSRVDELVQGNNTRLHLFVY